MTELIKIEETTVLQAFTDNDGLQDVIEKATELVNGFEHDLKTAAGRKKSISLAAKIGKLKTRLDGMGKDLVTEWKSKSKAVDVNRKAMRDALDELKIEARRPVTEWEDEKEKAEAIKQIETDHELAMLMNDKFNQDLAAAAEMEMIEQAAHEDRIKAEAIKQAQLDAIEAQQNAEAETKRQTQIAADAEKEKIRVQEQAKTDAIQAEKRRVAAEKQAKADAEFAAKAARDAEINRQEKQVAAEQAAQKAREQDRANVIAKLTEAKEALMSKCCLQEDVARRVVLAIKNNEIPSTSIKF